jgi:hypothetical protein
MQLGNKCKILCKVIPNHLNPHNITIKSNVEVKEVHQNMKSQPNIPWSEVIKKEARCLDEYDLGEVQEVHSDFVLTQKGVVDRKWFKIPKSLVHEFDGTKLYFAFTYQESSEYNEAADEEKKE